MPVWPKLYIKLAAVQAVIIWLAALSQCAHCMSYDESIL